MQIYVTLWKIEKNDLKKYGRSRNRFMRPDAPQAVPKRAENRHTAGRKPPATRSARHPKHNVGVSKN